MEPEQLELTKRESQIMNALYKHGASTVAEIAAAIPSPPSDTALRTLLRILEERGYVVASKAGRKNVYRTRVPREKAAVGALRQVLNTFFGGSLSGAVQAHLADPKTDLDRGELDRLARLIDDSTDKED